MDQNVPYKHFMQKYKIALCLITATQCPVLAVSAIACCILWIVMFSLFLKCTWLWAKKKKIWYLAFPPFSLTGQMFFKLAMPGMWNKITFYTSAQAYILSCLHQTLYYREGMLHLREEPFSFLGVYAFMYMDPYLNSTVYPFVYHLLCSLSFLCICHKVIASSLVYLN